MIKAHSMSNHSYRDSIAVFRSLIRDSSYFPNRYSFVFAFGACGNGLCVREGEHVFTHAVKVGLDGNVFVVNALIGMFGKWGHVDCNTPFFQYENFLNIYQSKQHKQIGYHI
ncbi:hypothetical protein MtrunA17_Chr6g0476381 [Medicago truncatula]|nr:hypothetical protein MtrunA17_Chr6g0476381 [Medicago truncatula]